MGFFFGVLRFFVGFCKILNMEFPRFWARGSEGEFSCWRWSNQSVEDAKSLAIAAARRLAERFSTGEFTRSQRYAYGDRPLREQVLREFKDETGAMAGAVTRNAYGCIVLNTARLMFVDVDLPDSSRRGNGGFFRNLFGKPKPDPSSEAEAQTLAKAAAWAKGHSGWGWRVYRTRAGFRLLATHASFEPSNSICDAVFDALGADPLYRTLCRRQNSFRARLTPKPWRCGVYKRPERWPWSDAKTEQRFKDWEERYLKACEKKATCRFLATIGTEAPIEETQPLIGFHDEVSRSQSDLPLA